MATTTVSITFEATSLEDAQAKMAGWTLHEGCAVSATLTAPVPPTPGSTDASGTVVPVAELPLAEPPPE